MLTFRVPEIHCAGCIRSLTSAVHEMDATATLHADLATKRVTVETSASGAAVAAAFEDAGFVVEPQ